MRINGARFHILTAIDARVGVVVDPSMKTAQQSNLKGQDCNNQVR